MQTWQLIAIPSNCLIDSSRTLVDIVLAFDFATLFVYLSVNKKQYLIFA